MPRLLVVLGLIALKALLPAGAREGPVDPRLVRIDSGDVLGRERDGMCSWLGIPYAAPPVGDLRWRPPRAVVPWEGVRDCNAFGPSCPQPSGFVRDRRGVGPTGEDCLTLNVWSAAAPRERRPVMVWIHGGGFTTGSGSLSYYDGAPLARRGVVLVTINYRLGPFGFFAHPALSAESERKVSGNYGLLDQIAALDWVRRNIAAFGGDPGRVTIFGESAGAASVAALMVSPLAKGLFHRAIAQSGGVSGIDRKLRETWRGRLSLESRGGALSAQLGCEKAEDPAAALRAVSAEALLAASRAEPATIDPERRYGPVVDGYVLPDDPVKLWREGKQHALPLIAGSTADDGSVFAREGLVRSEFGYRLAVRRVFGADAEAVLALFPPAREGEVSATFRRLVTISSFVAPAREMARAMERVPAKAWLYHFTRVTPAGRLLGLGAPHGCEIPFVFGNPPAGLPVGEVDRELSEAIQRYWVSFAATGVPATECDLFSRHAALRPR
ncbi:MAG: carboxylesterase family protein [Planctomycetes bacterium]|nr:carboxylesterase family protein [Planctomycetota bacterium]